MIGESIANLSNQRRAVGKNNRGPDFYDIYVICNFFGSANEIGLDMGIVCEL
jgi:hypothetical protein